MCDVANWKFIVSGNDYAATFKGAPSPLRHFWSLSLEEQSYLVMPVLVAFSLHRARRPKPVGRHSSPRPTGGRGLLIAVLGLVVLGSTAAMVTIGGGAYSNRVYMGTDTRIAELAVGGLVAALVIGRGRDSSGVALGRRTSFVMANAAGPAALGAIVATWMLSGLKSDWLYRGGFLVHATLVATVVVAAIQPHCWLGSALSWTPLRYLGRISYGVYLFHWPIVRWLTPARLGGSHLTALLVQLGVTVVTASLSFHLLERPIRLRRWIPAPRAFAGVAFGSVAVLSLGAWALPAPRPSTQLAMGTSGTRVTPKRTATHAAPPVRVMVAGDSFALSIGHGLENYVATKGRIALLNDGIVGCAFGRGGWNRGIGLQREFPDECKLRDEKWSGEIASFRPDVVFIAGGMWDITDRRLTDDGPWTTIGDPAYDTYLVKEILHLADFFAERNVKVVWATAPDFHPQYNPETFMGKPPYAEATPGRADRFNSLLRRALALRPDVTVVDFAAWVRAWPGGEFDPTIRIDGVHISIAAADKASDWLVPKLIAKVRGTKR
ncbi:MAG: acyltransferase family protein [Microthrixaceae bacterium]